MKSVQEAVNQLDKNMGDVVSSLLEGELIGSMEQVNPFQALISQFIQSKFDSMPKDLAVIEKDPQGKFKKS